MRNTLGSSCSSRLAVLPSLRACTYSALAASLVRIFAWMTRSPTFIMPRRSKTQKAGRTRPFNVTREGGRTSRLALGHLLVQGRGAIVQALGVGIGQHAHGRTIALGLEHELVLVAPAGAHGGIGAFGHGRHVLLDHHHHAAVFAIGEEGVDAALVAQSGDLADVAQALLVEEAVPRGRAVVVLAGALHALHAAH